MTNSFSPANRATLSVTTSSEPIDSVTFDIGAIKEQVRLSCCFLVKREWHIRFLMWLLPPLGITVSREATVLQNCTMTGQTGGCDFTIELRRTSCDTEQKEGQNDQD